MQLPDFLIDHPDGEIRLKGSRISLYHVVFYYRDGEGPEAQAERFGSLTASRISQVIDFYEQNRDEVDAYVAQYQADLDRQRAEAPPIEPLFEKWKRRLEEIRQGNPK